MFSLPACDIYSSIPGDKIIGGVEAVEGEFPWMVFFGILNAELYKSVHISIFSYCICTQYMIIIIVSVLTLIIHILHVLFGELDNLWFRQALLQWQYFVVSIRNVGTELISTYHMNCSSVRQVALGYLNRDYKVTFKCGGTIISDYFILTAAHCTTTQQYPVVVRFGRVSID